MERSSMLFATFLDTRPGVPCLLNLTDYGYVGLHLLSLFFSENRYAVKSLLNCFVLGSWTCMLSHHSSWFERLHGHCDQP